MKFEIINQEGFVCGQFPTKAIADIMLKALEALYTKDEFRVKLVIEI